MTREIGKAAPFVQSENPNDIVVKVRDRHFRIRESDARRLLRGQRDADLYSLTGHTRHGSINLISTEFYRVKTNNIFPAFLHRNRFELVVREIYWWAPVLDWCREAGK